MLSTLSREAAACWPRWSSLPCCCGRSARSCSPWPNWQNDSRYTHGYLVPLFSAYLLWVRRERFAAAGLRPSWWGVLVLAGGLAGAAAGTYAYFEAAERRWRWWRAWSG